MLKSGKYKAIHTKKPLDSLPEETDIYLENGKLIFRHKYRDSSKPASKITKQSEIIGEPLDDTLPWGDDVNNPCDIDEDDVHGNANCGDSEPSPGDAFAFKNALNDDDDGMSQEEKKMLQNMISRFPKIALWMRDTQRLVVCRRTCLTHHFLIVGVHVISQIMLRCERSRALWRKIGMVRDDALPDRDYIW